MLYQRASTQHCAMIPHFTNHLVLYHLTITNLTHQRGQVRFLICTDVAARGLDVSGLPYGSCFIVQFSFFVVFFHLLMLYWVLMSNGFLSIFYLLVSWITGIKFDYDFGNDNQKKIFFVTFLIRVDKRFFSTRIVFFRYIKFIASALNYEEKRFINTALQMSNLMINIDHQYIFLHVTQPTSSSSFNNSQWSTSPCLMRSRTMSIGLVGWAELKGAFELLLSNQRVSH